MGYFTDFRTEIRDGETVHSTRCGLCRSRRDKPVARTEGHTVQALHRNEKRHLMEHHPGAYSPPMMHSWEWR